MFINMLFDGDDVRFNQVLSTLENKQSYEDAIGFLGAEFPNWDVETEEVMEFIEIVRKRY